jgi:D-glycero-D-manno-heptose 1,7-bisphosphate phosphatase
VVSNQQGVGKGLMTEKQVNGLHDKMLKEISDHGGRIDAVYFSPHLESSGSVMRKPAIGMALRARRQFPEIRFKQSVMAGDSLSDMVFGKRVGMKTVFLSDNPSPAKQNPRLIDYYFCNLKSFADVL